MSEASPSGVLSVRDAHKTFGRTVALQGASLELREGELLGLLGPNGAGKTTLVRAIAGRVRLDRGAIELFGRALDGSGARAGLGIVPQDLAVYPRLTARENMEVFARFHGVADADLKPKVEWALEWTGLADRAREPVRNFSGGMRRRLNIACGVLHAPRVVLLDEPTVGVDPQSRERIYGMLERLRDSGVSLLLTTHQLEEAEARCQRIVIIDHGRVIASGTPAELVQQTVGGGRLVTLVLEEALPAVPPGLEADASGRALQARVQDVAAELPALLRRVEEAGGRVHDVEVRGASLHAVFLHLTGRELRE
jgi:ABC-2 type transport system ATP-binding protein